MNILDSGINLMLYGMGTVFVFLSILILTTMTMSWIIGRFMPPSESSGSPTPSQHVAAQTTQIDPQVLSVLQAAVRAHKES